MHVIPSAPAHTIARPALHRLAFVTAAVTFLMIVIGAVTRVTESGMGCGPYWPSCNGHIIPAFEDLTVVIEYGHRLFALLVGLFAGLVSLRAWRHYRQIPGVFNPAMLGLALFFVQSGLGAVTVALYNAWVSVLLHLATSMVLLAAYLVTWIRARAVDVPPAQEQPSAGAVFLPPVELVLATALSFLVAMVGAAVAGNEATKACVGWPLCGGALWPAEQGPLQMLHMLHRLVAGALGLLLVLMLWQARRAARPVRNALAAALGMYVLQAALGALMIFVDGRELLTLTRALHVTFAALTWAALVVASTHAWLQRLNVNRSAAAPSPVAASATISR